jgi:hypothetical protein
MKLVSSFLIERRFSRRWRGNRKTWHIMTIPS